MKGEMKMKKIYEAPIIEITRFKTEDILNASDMIVNSNKVIIESGTDMEEIRPPFSN